MAWGPGGIFGNWFEGDILNDRGSLGAIRDNTGANADVRNRRLGTFWRGKDGNVYVAGSNGVNSAGRWDDNSAYHWGNQGYRHVADPRGISGRLGAGNLTIGGGQPSQGYQGDAPTWQSFTGGGWGSGGGGGGQAARDKANAIAAYDEEIRQANDALGRLGAQQGIGESNAAKARDRAFTENENSFNQARGMYDMNTRDAIDRIKKTRDQVESDAADKIRSARGVFAAGGAADSSFAKILAPFMIGKEASKQQGQAQDTYARNRREMDINYAATENAYKKNKRDVQGEYDNRINGICQKIQGTRSDLEDRIRRANINKGVANGSSLAAAQASQREAADHISGYGREIDQLSADRSIPVEKVEWRAPKLDSYETRDVAVKPENAENGAVNDQIAPNLQPLLDTDDKKKKEAWGW